VIKIDKYHALIFITWLILTLKMSAKCQQEISLLVEHPWFISNQYRSFIIDMQRYWSSKM